MYGHHLAKRTEEADQYLSFAQQRQVSFAGLIVRAVTKHLKNNVGLGEDLRAINGEGCTLGDVIGVGIAGFATGTGFNDDFESSFFKIGNDCGHKRDPPLPRENLAGNTDQHEGASTKSTKWRTLHSNWVE